MLVSRTGPISLRCMACGETTPEGLPGYCMKCGFPLEVAQEGYPDLTPAVFGGSVYTMWKYAGAYPLHDIDGVGLGEGGTPLVPLLELDDHLGFGTVAAKLEYLNPSGSFKDRGVSVAVRWCLERALPGVVCASSGNAAASVGAYAARFGLPAVVVVPENTPEPKLLMARGYGIHVLRVRGDYAHAFAIVGKIGQELGWANLTTTYVNPYVREGFKSISYEVFEQLSRAPDWVVVPVGSGPLLAGVHRGFQELKALGLIESVPRMLAVQAAGCSPIARAFQEGRDTVTAWDTVTTSASGISDPLRGYARDGTVTLRVVRESGGAVVAVDDADIEAAAADLARSQGMFIELSGAAAWAGALALQKSTGVLSEHLVVLLLTGHGLKDPGTAGSPVQRVSSMEEALDTVREWQSTSFREGGKRPAENADSLSTPERRVHHGKASSDLCADGQTR